MNCGPIVDSSTSREEAIRAFQIDGNLIRKTPQFQGDRELALIAITHVSNPFSHPYYYISDELKRDIPLACIAASAHPYLIGDFHRRVRASREIWAIRLKDKFIDCRHMRRNVLLADDDELFTIAAQGYLDFRSTHPHSCRYGSLEVIKCFSRRIRSYFDSVPLELNRYTETINWCKQNIQTKNEREQLAQVLPPTLKQRPVRRMKI